MKRRKVKLKAVITSILLSLSVFAIAQNQSVRFEHLTTKNGLSINRVTSIYKDKLGYMWFGTYWGLNRFDGKEFTNYFHDSDSEELTLNHNSVLWIAEGPGDLIFIQNGSLISAFDIYKEQFVDISHILNAIPVNSGQINEVVKDQRNDLWLICDGFGLLKMDDKGEVTFLNEDGKGKYKNRPNASDVNANGDGTLSVLHSDGTMVRIDSKTFDIIEEWRFQGLDRDYGRLEFTSDSRNGYWIHAQNETKGVYYFRDKEKLPELFSSDVLGSNLVSEVLEYDSNNIIVATDHGGLTIFDLEDGSRSRHVHNPSDPTSLNHYGAISAYKDDEGTIWIGTNKGGISFFNPTTNFFSYYKYETSPEESFNDINAVLFEDDENLWVGSDRGGLMKFDLKKGEFQLINKSSGLSRNDLKSKTVVSLAKAKNGIWVGTYHGGLSFFNGSRFVNYMDHTGKYDIPDNSVWSLFIDSSANLWVGTLKEGIVVFDGKGKKIKEINIGNGLVDSNYVTSIDEDENGHIWLGTGYGVLRANPKNWEIKQFLSDNNNPDSVVNNSIENLLCNGKGQVWIGTQRGVSVYDLNIGTFKSFKEKEGFISSYIVSIEQDQSGNLWFGTNKGISNLQYKDEQVVIRNFNESDGLQAELFNQHSSDQSESGLMAFAGANGLNIFKPSDIRPSSRKTRLVFNQLQIANRQVKSGQHIQGRVLLKDGLNKLDQIDLKHFENSFSIGFAALNYRRPDKVLYRYMLEGFDQGWITVRANQRSANYTNLDPGEYVFKVQSTNDNGQWGDSELQVAVFIDTPFWKTPLAYLGYFVIGLAILYLTLRIRIDRERLKSEIESEKIQAKRLHELDLMKIRFFTNIGHEFRTPLTLILTPIERIIKSVEESDYKNEFFVIQKNAKRLLTLVNQLLDFRKMEAGQHQLSLSGGDFVKFMRDIVESFSDLSKENDVEIVFETEYKEFLTQFDRDKMEKVMFNLFSNAFKFTQPGGRITLNIKCAENGEEQDLIQVSLNDTGIGIAEENMGHVFARFYQSDAPSNMINHGSGIGLSITKEFVELHHGKIWVESKVNVGSTFFVELPLIKRAALEEMTEIHPVRNNERESVKDAMNTLNNQKYTVILVEDNVDFRFYLKDNLGQYFNILEAENGEVGYEKVLRHQPDLIVSDVMMPVMNGIDMTLKLKKDRKTRHIPIILLSSHQSDSHKIEGLKAGAIDFISKPFNFEILKSRIKSALSLKEDIADSQKKIEVSPTEIAVTSLDEKLIQKALAIVEENMANADFSVQELSRELGVSRAQLYKKVVSITGQSPIEFIRDIRLKRAALLLEKSQLSVSEIAYKVGFNNPRYFSNYFKAAYHVLPSKYLESLDKETELNHEI